jgi:flagellar protein FlaJ
MVAHIASVVAFPLQFTPVTSGVGLVPLVIALIVVSIVPLSTVYQRANTMLTYFSRRYFGRYVPDEAPERKQRLRAAYIDETYRSYAAKTYLVTVLFMISGSIVGIYVFEALLLVLPIVGDLMQGLPNTMTSAIGNPELDPANWFSSETQVFYAAVVAGAIAGTGLGGLTYWWRWESPRSQGEVRRRGINEGLPRNVAFIYALSRGGMSIPKVMDVLAENRSVYGDAADEISVATREMNLFGSDMVTAVRHVADRTPSEQFKTFSENLASVMQSGQNISEFLHEQYEKYRDEAAERQSEILELLATIAEAYVTILVAGVLFMMTILIIFGLTTTDTLVFLKLMTYALVPIANIGFMVYLAQQLEMLGVDQGADTGNLEERINEQTGMPVGDQVEADGGTFTSSAVKLQLAAYDSVEILKKIVKQPIDMFLWQPSRILYITIPIALLSIAIRAPNAFLTGSLNLRVFDDILIQAALFVFATFAIVWELYRRRLRRIEGQMPELLERLASLNEAGMSVVESIDRAREGDLGILSEEVERIWQDVRFGATVDDAFRRFGLRVRTTALTRVITLITNALRASGNMAPVLRIAAEQAADEIRLRRRRRQEMLTYLVVIYISFAVFLVIIVSVQEVLVANLPTDVPTPQDTGRLGVNADQFARLGQVNKAAYTLVFAHTALMQAVMSGFIGGQLGEGSIKDGAKHAAIMLSVAYLAFIIVSSPVAQVTFEEGDVENGAVVVDSVSISKGGFLTIRVYQDDGEIIGVSEYLEPGTHENVRIEVSSSPRQGAELFAVPHIDTNGNEEFDWTEFTDVDKEYPEKRTSNSDSARVGGDSESIRPPAAT